MYSGLETFGKVVEHRAKEKPHARFVRFSNVDITYDRLHRDGNKVANFMTALHLTKGANLCSHAAK